VAEPEFNTERFDTERRVRRGPDAMTLIVGVVTLIASAYMLGDGDIWLPRLDFRWIVAGGALLVGLLLLASSLRSGRRRDR